MTEADLFQITRTNTKRYVGVCNVEGCDFRTDVISLRLNCAVRLRDHCRIVHHSYAADLFLKREATVKQAKREELPEAQELGEKIGDYADKLIVIEGGAWAQTRHTSFGDRETREATVYVFDADRDHRNVWTSLGEIPIFFKTVQAQIDDAAGDDLCGILHQGTQGLRDGKKGNANEWVLLEVPEKNTRLQQAIAAFEALDRTAIDAF